MRLLFASVFVVIVLAVIAASLFTGDDQIQVRTITSNLKANIGGPFELVNHRGQTVSDKTFRGKHLLMFFGFTNCPDVCPMSMSEIALTLELLKDKADQIQALFISVDPDRDTPDQLGQFVEAFDKRIVGLTGTNQQIAKVAKNYKIYYQKVGLNQKAKGFNKDLPLYQVNHSAITYLISPEGEFIRHFPYGTKSQDMVKFILGLLN